MPDDTGLRAGDGIEAAGVGLGEDVDMQGAVGDGVEEGGFDGIEGFVDGMSPIFDGLTPIEATGFDGINAVVVVGTSPVFTELIVGDGVVVGWELSTVFDELTEFNEVEVVVDGLGIGLDSVVVVVVVEEVWQALEPDFVNLGPDGVDIDVAVVDITVRRVEEDAVVDNGIGTMFISFDGLGDRHGASPVADGVRAGGLGKLSVETVNGLRVGGFDRHIDCCCCSLTAAWSNVLLRLLFVCWIWFGFGTFLFAQAEWLLGINFSLIK